MKFQLVRLILENFMTYSEKTVDFGNVTRICGKNGKGKSSILTAYMWLLFNSDYELKDNPSIRKDGVTDADVSVTAVFNIDGKEVTAKKVQKRKFGKDGVSYSDDNTYFINDVPKTLRDFNDYFQIDMNSFKICSNVNAFINGKPKEMRDFLFGTVDDISDIDVAHSVDELQPLCELLEKYTREEIEAMNKASKAKVSKELPILDGQIKEAELNCNVDIDVAELELKKNVINEEIVKIKSQIEDSNKASADYKAKSDEIMALKKRLSDMERVENEKLMSLRQDKQNLVYESEKEFSNTRNDINSANMQISNTESAIKNLEEQKKKMQDKYLEERAKTYPEYVPLAELDPNSLVCPTCGQNLPDDVKTQKIEDYEQRKASHKAEYDSSKAKFEETKKATLDAIAKTGNETNASITAMEKSVEDAKVLLEKYKQASVDAMAKKNKAMAELEAVPTKADLNDNDEYIAIISQIAEKEASLIDSSDKDYRSQLNIKIEELRRDLTATELEIAKADTSAAEERLEQLKKQRIDMEQLKTDCEKYLYLLDLLDKHKNEVLADKINEKFSFIKWQLFELNKSGGYKSVCIPTMDGRSIMDIHSNKGNRILGKLDICNSIQKIANINCPVFLDDAESLDDENAAKLLDMMDCQTVLLKVTNDDLKVEVEE